MVAVKVLDSGIMLHKPGGRIKALPRGNGLIEGYVISFGSPGDSDLEGQWFTPLTDIRPDYFQDWPVLFHHGMDKTVGLDPIGRIKALNKDSVGWHVQAFLDLHDPFGREVYEMLGEKPFGWSSGSVDHLVIIQPSGEIVRWPLFEGSVTPAPMQPHKTTVRALKSILGSNYPWNLRGLSLKARAGEGNDQFDDEGEKTMLKARPSTLSYVSKVLKASGFKATERQKAKIAAKMDAEDQAMMADDELDDAVMGFGGDEVDYDDAAMAFGDEPDGDEATMDDYDDAEMAFDDEDDAALSFDDEDDATLAFDDEDDNPATLADWDTPNESQDSSFLNNRKTARRKTAQSARRTKAYVPPELQGYINRLEKRVKALELEEAPGERSFGMKSVRVTKDAADRPGAYKAAFTNYIRSGEIGMTDSMRYILRKGQVDYGPADSIKGAATDRVKALNTSNAGSVGFAVPDDFVAELNRNIMVEAKTAQDCKSRTTTSDTILIPDLVTSDARRAYAGRVTWTGETAANQAEHNADPISLGQINLPIHVMLVSTVASYSSLEDSVFDLQAYITEAFSEMIAIEYEELIMLGNGQGKMQGIVTDSRITGAASTSVSSVSGYIASGSAAAIEDADKLRSMLMQLPPQYRGRAKWYMNSNTADIVSRLKDGQGRYLWGDEQGLNSGIPNNLINRPVVYNEWMSDVAAGAFPLVLADLSRAYTIGKRVEFSVRRFDDSAYAVMDQCLLLGRARLGGQPTLPAAVKVLKVAAS